MKQAEKMNVLLIGNGVIGSVYASQFALEGHSLWVLAHGERDSKLVKRVIQVKDVVLDTVMTAHFSIAELASSRSFDLVLVAVRLEQLSSTFSALRTLTGKPHILFLGNNPDGHEAIPADLVASVQLGFPGIGGKYKGEIIEYMHIAQQAMVLEKTNSPISNEIHTVLKCRGFKVEDSSFIDGWLKYHAVFISCISMALLREQADSVKLGNNRELLALMCRSIEEGFGALRKQGVKGVPTSLAVLQHPLLRPIAIRYWGNLLRSPKGELYFGAHVKHAEAEVLALVTWVMKHSDDTAKPLRHLHMLLTKLNG